MNIVIVLIVIILLLFAIAYFTRRRFGVLGLALCAGYLLSTMWTAQVTPFIRDAGFELIAPPLSTLVAVTLVLLPAIILLFSGPTYTRSEGRLIGSGVFALLATALLLGPLGSSLSLDTSGQTIYHFLIENKSLIITAAIGYALFDILTLRPPKHSK